MLLKSNDMKNIVFLLVMWFFSNSVLSQVGIGTTSPQGQLDVVTTNDTGLVIPRVSSVANVTDGQGNPPVDGTIVYDTSQEAICFFTNGKWLCGTFNNVGQSDWGNGNPPFNTNQVYVKASNTSAGDSFGSGLALSDDGLTLAIGASLEDSNATGINGDQTNDSAVDSGAVYIYREIAGVWTFEAYIKASNTDANDEFGIQVSLSADGNTLAVSATEEDSNATGINGNQSDNSALGSGAVYIFTRTGSTWSQQAYIKSSNSEANDGFGLTISLDNLGDTLLATTSGEDSNATGINGNQSDNSASSSGAAYVFTRSGSVWTQEAYLKASNTDLGDLFGTSGAISGDGTYAVIGADGEDSNATGINGDQSNNTVSSVGAVYVFIKSGSVWSQQAYIKPNVIGLNDQFGDDVGIDDDGSRIIVTSVSEDSNATGINGDDTNNSASGSGAAYVFSRSGTTWSQEAYVKATNTEAGDGFNDGICISGDGNTIIIGAQTEDGNGIGTNGDPFDNSSFNSGASYVYEYDGTEWQFKAYVKATNTQASDWFGLENVTNTTGSTIVISSQFEASNATGINGDQSDNSAFFAGAVYLYEN